MPEPRLTLDPVPLDERHGLTRYPVPLQGLRTALLLLPADLTAGDAARIIGVLETLIPAPPAAEKVWDLDHEG
jgi:hypothetical protein